MRNRQIATLLTLLGLALVLAGPAVADEPLAEVENLGDTLVFHPIVEYAQLILTVTGPCDYQYRQVVTKGEPAWRLDKTTIDGAYRYDLVRVESIDPEIVKILQVARIKNDEEVPKALCRDGKLPAPPASQSFGFAVERGEILWDPRATEKALRGDGDGDGLAAGGAIATKDFVINDDLIVDGSACIGFDCVNGESFGFDTVRLKENNLRIKFDDTSTAASFPRNDWQLTANDSANGGASKFSIDDISNSRTPFTVEANARSHSLYVDDGGRIGSRTSTPSVEIHTVDGDTPTLRLQQDGSSGFAPQTWDVAGNETNFFVRDVSNGSTLPFRIRPGAPSSAIYIDVDGDVGIGTSSPDADGIHVVRSSALATFRNLAIFEANGPPGMFFSDVSANDHHWEFRMTSGGVFRISDTNASATDDGTVEFDLNTSGDLTIAGSLTVGPGGCTGCDLVFSPGYPVESIEDHAEFMWANSFLPGVGPTPEDQPMNISRKTGGMLNELEKAHIYIEQLHKELADQKEALGSQQQLIEQLMARLEAVEKTH